MFWGQPTLALVLLLANPKLGCANGGSEGQTEEDRGEAASFDVRCDVCKSLLADLSVVAEPVRQQLHAEGTTGRGTTVAETTMKTIAGMCDLRSRVPGVLGLYKLHDCEGADAMLPDELEIDKSHAGGLVTLADGYEDEGDAADGPLLPGETATLETVLDDKVYVTARTNGKSWWYLHAAVKLIRSPICAKIKPPQRYTAEHYRDVTAESVKARINKDEVRAWEVHAHRIMCVRYWKPLAEDLTDVVMENEIGVDNALGLEFCVEKGLCKEEREQRVGSKGRTKKKKGGATAKPGKLGTRSDEL